jgi:hypothetical protein
MIQTPLDLLNPMLCDRLYRLYRLLDHQRVGVAELTSKPHLSILPKALDSLLKIQLFPDESSIII